jgi:hypothetical protein
MPSKSDIRDRVATATAAQEKRRGAAKRRERVQGRVARSAYSISSFAVEVDKDPATIWRWLKRGVIQSVTFAGGTLIPASELDRVLQGGGPKRGPRPRAEAGKFAKKDPAS